MTDYVSRARARKVEAITMAVDRAWLERDVNPFDPEVIRRTIKRLTTMSATEWSELCAKHGIHDPSDETTRDAIQYFSDRLTQVQSSRLEARGEDIG